MLHQPLLDQPQEPKLTGMRQALQEQLQMPDIDSLSFTDRLGLLVDQERTERTNRRLQYRLQKARLQPASCPEDLGASRAAWIKPCSSTCSAAAG